MIWLLILWLALEAGLLYEIHRNNEKVLSELLILGGVPSIILLVAMIIVRPSVLYTGNILILWVIPVAISEGIPFAYMFLRDRLDARNRAAAEGNDSRPEGRPLAAKTADRSIAAETARRVALTGITNDLSLDVFSEDGMHYDRKRFHSYSDYRAVFTIIEEGRWTSWDNGCAWHVEDLVVQDKASKSYHRYRFDIRFDGAMYYMENGARENAAEMKWLRSGNPAKCSTSDLSDLEFNTAFIVSPAQISGL